MMPRLAGPSHSPASGGKPRRLVILLHGLGADGRRGGKEPFATKVDFPLSDR